MPERKRNEPLLFWELCCLKSLVRAYVCQGDFFSKSQNEVGQMAAGSLTKKLLWCVL